LSRPACGNLSIVDAVFEKRTGRDITPRPVIIEPRCLFLAGIFLLREISGVQQFVSLMAARFSQIFVVDFLD